MDGMLDRMSPEVFAEWCAKDDVEPIGYQSRALGLISYQLAAYMAGEKANEVDAELYMPWMKYEPKEKPNNQNAAAAIRSIFGN